MVFRPVTVWSLVSLSLQSAFPEESWSIFALFTIHPSAGHGSSSLRVPRQRSSIPCSCSLQSGAVFSIIPPLAPSQASVSCSSPQLLCIVAQAHCSLQSQCERSSLHCIRDPFPELGLLYPSLPSWLSSLFSTLSFFLICIQFLPS